MIPWIRDYVKHLRSIDLRGAWNNNSADPGRISPHSQYGQLCIGQADLLKTDRVDFYLNALQKNGANWLGTDVQKMIQQLEYLGLILLVYEGKFLPAGERIYEGFNCKMANILSKVVY